MVVLSERPHRTVKPGEPILPLWPQLGTLRAPKGPEKVELPTGSRQGGADPQASSFT